MIKKLAKRLYKLNLIAKNLDTNLSNLVKITLDSAYNTIKIIREQLNNKLNLKLIKHLGLKYNFDLENGLRFHKNTNFHKEINRLINFQIKNNFIKISQKNNTLHY